MKKNKKLADTITNAFVFMGALFPMCHLWKYAEVQMYEFSQQSAVDCVMAMILSGIITGAVYLWRNSKVSGK